MFSIPFSRNYITNIRACESVAAACVRCGKAHHNKGIAVKVIASGGTVMTDSEFADFVTAAKESRFYEPEPPMTVRRVCVACVRAYPEFKHYAVKE